MEHGTRATMLRVVVWAMIGVGAGLIVWQMMTPVTEQAQPVEEPVPTRVCAPSPVEQSPTPPALVVYVSGAVVAPGLYEGDAQMRVGEMVALAGGLVAGAQVEQLNMAEPIYDAMHIHVPTQAQSGAIAQPGTVSKGVLNINQATARELEALPGIGPSLAERIVAHREAHGAFADADALGAVPGLGDVLIQKILALIVFR
jgi:competence protein ComEA